MKTPLLILGLALAIPGMVHSSEINSTSLQTLARDAVSSDPTLADPAIQSLRDAGPPGLATMMQVHADTISDLSMSGILPAAVVSTQAADWARLKSVLERISRQRDAHASGLYWFTDLDRARAESKTSGRPILSLRLLGNLDEDLSCANSRFFRTTLYANAEVSRFLRDNFVLHWQSVRPAPRITIDFGDGRTLERTITGNSAHYILDSEGRPIDVLPGLYGPQAFRRALTPARDAARTSEKMDAAARAEFLRHYHRDRLAAVTAQWSEDMARIGAAISGKASLKATHAIAADAVSADSVTATKRQVERPLLDHVTASARHAQLESATNDAAWKRMAQLHAGTVKLDESSTALIRAKNPNAFAAGRLAVGKAFVEDPLLRAIRNLERSIAEDTVRNEYLLRARIHEWFAGDAAPAQVEALNAKVYAELFLMPDSDPWLGLAPQDAYSALDNEGLFTAAARRGYE